MSTPIISLKDVSYRYPHSRGEGGAALQGISLDINQGEFVGLVGANGSGKSTLARLLNGLIEPDGGEVIIDGMSTRSRHDLDRIRETVGMVFQNPENQIVATSVEDDIAFGPENLGLPAEEIERRVDEACRRFGLEHLRRSEPHWLSGGQKQRTVLAGVMALGPRVLVLDEPTSMLDPRSQRQFLDFVHGLWRSGVTVIYITQLMEEVAAAPRVIAIAAGGAAFDGDPRELFSNEDLLVRTSLEPPLATRLGAALAARGRPLRSVLTLEELVGEVCRPA
ncbi:MAG: ATP-binding cassette domain-containing protein [Actinobacteria bacterium]|nr:ATP-binding cassette domain-containing protein [Actinomycetota bacterium]